MHPLEQGGHFQGNMDITGMGGMGGMGGTGGMGALQHCPNRYEPVHVRARERPELDDGAREVVGCPEITTQRAGGTVSARTTDGRVTRGRTTDLRFLEARATTGDSVRCGHRVGSRISGVG
jgi:hypothetical protein